MSEQSKSIVQYMKSDTVLQNFAAVLGNERGASAYIMNVVIAVNSEPNLASCAVDSIYASALRAATLRLSVDPSSKQAYLVPYKGKCTLIVGYKGYYDLAMRTGRYRYINAVAIREGETVEIDRLSDHFRSFGGKKESNKVIGYLGAFEMVGGYHKAIYRTVEEIHAHKEKYAKGYERDSSAWKTATQQMEKKTVLRELLTNWGTFDPADQAVLGEIGEVESDVIDVEATEPLEQNPAEQELAELGFEQEIEIEGAPEDVPDEVDPEIDDLQPVTDRKSFLAYAYGDLKLQKEAANVQAILKEAEPTGDWGKAIRAVNQLAGFVE